MNFCEHKFVIKDSRGDRFCRDCGRKRGDYIHQLEEEIKRLRRNNRK
jgi:hypothetical protein